MKTRFLLCCLVLSVGVLMPSSADEGAFPLQWTVRSFTTDPPTEPIGSINGRDIALRTAERAVYCWTEVPSRSQQVEVVLDDVRIESRGQVIAFTLSSSVGGKLISTDLLAMEDDTLRIRVRETPWELEYKTLFERDVAAPPTAVTYRHTWSQDDESLQMSWVLRDADGEEEVIAFNPISFHARQSVEPFRLLIALEDWSNEPTLRATITSVTAAEH